ncbi:MAG TPA: ATP phosphoribosyltransferase regulatory subunit [Methylophilaceae bacterium]
MRHWLLPEYIEDVLPAEAQHIEQLRRKLLDLFRTYGYQFVIPPLLEYLESLNAGVGHDLDLLTFKVVDQLSGRLMGIRSDITPQAARIDAQRLNQEGVTRLCYAGSVLRTQADGAAQTRQPLQVGVELFGHSSIESDLEIQRLMVQSLRLAGATRLVVDLSHVTIFRTLITRAGITAETETDLFAALQGKDSGALQALLSDADSATRDAIMALPTLSGGIEILQQAQQVLPQYAEIKLALQDLKRASQQLTELDVEVSLDLSELRGYHYHSGMVFAAYTDGQTSALALGGRYDFVGQIFGRSRPATGFSMDMRTLTGLSAVTKLAKGILAPYAEDAELQQKIEQLREKGEMVIVDLPGHQQQVAELNCDRKLVKNDKGWEIVPNR